MVGSIKFATALRNRSKVGRYESSGVDSPAASAFSTSFRRSTKYALTIESKSETSFTTSTCFCGIRLFVHRGPLPVSEAQRYQSVLRSQSSSLRKESPVEKFGVTLLRAGICFLSVRDDQTFRD